jgi:hypothetical protein
MEPSSTHEVTGQHYSAILALDIPTSGYIRITPAIIDSTVLWDSDIVNVDIGHYVTTRSASLFSIDTEDFQYTLEDRLDEIINALKAVIAVLDAVENGEWDAIIT